MALYIDSGIYDDGDLYEDTSSIPLGYVAKAECHAHYVGLRLKYTASQIPGSGEAFRIVRATLRAATDSQGDHTHTAYFDKVEATDHVGLRIKHTGSEFQVWYVRTDAKMRRAQVRE